MMAEPIALDSLTRRKKRPNALDIRSKELAESDPSATPEVGLGAVAPREGASREGIASSVQVERQFRHGSRNGWKSVRRIKVTSLIRWCVAAQGGPHVGERQFRNALAGPQRTMDGEALRPNR